MSSVLTALLMLRFLWIAWPRSRSANEPLPPGLAAPWLALAAAWLTVPWVLALPELRASAAGWHAAWDASWPLLLAGAIAITALRLRRAGRVPEMPRVPAGDLGISLERGLLALGHALGRFSRHDIPRLRDALKGAAGTVIRTGPEWSDRLGHGEARIAAWSMTGMLVLLLAVTFAWLLA
jgi:hypothetical protein